MAEQKRIEITEHDEAGNITATYVQSRSDQKGTSRIDVILPEKTKSPWQQLLDVFLPSGYPHTVTDDYLEYQIYDSLQAFTSSIASLLSSRAVLSSVGVGDSTASPTAALLLSIVQESFGRVATILFAHRLGPALAPECKTFRLLADVLNDLAFLLDASSALLATRQLRLGVLAAASVLRALCGVAAGSAKASLSTHFARRADPADLNAKDASQETVISLAGMLVGSVVVAAVRGPAAEWTLLVALLALHLEANRRAVKAVCMRSLNRQRAGLVWAELVRHGRVPSPAAVAAAERVFRPAHVLRDPRGRAVGRCVVGASAARLLDAVRAGAPLRLEQVLALYRDAKYVLWRREGESEFFVVVKKDAAPVDVLVAWWQALFAATDEKPAEGDDEGEFWRRSRRKAEALLERYGDALRERGWDLDDGALETRARTRVAMG